MPANPERQRKSKKEAEPEVVIQEAVPAQTTETKDSTKEESKMERLSPIPFDIIKGLPDGMKSENRLIEESIRHNVTKQQEDIESSEQTARLLKLGALAAGIGVGVILCVKGYKYVFPIIEKATEATTETIE